MSRLLFTLSEVEDNPNFNYFGCQSVIKQVKADYLEVSLSCENIFMRPLSKLAFQNWFLFVYPSRVDYFVRRAINVHLLFGFELFLAVLE